MRRAIRLLIELLVCTIVGRRLAELLRYLADDLGVGWATTIVRPFGLVGFVFGNIHQGDRQLSAMTLTVALALVLFLVWRDVVIVRPFGLVGFVFGNIHQGDRQLSAMTLTVALALVLFLVWRLALRFRQRRI